MKGSHGLTSKYIIIAAIIVSVITFLVYIPALQNSFVNWDDNVYVYENSGIRSLDLEFLKWVFASPIHSNWHPLTMLSYALDYKLWGLEPMGYHLTSILFHSANSALVFLLAIRLIESLSRANLSSAKPNSQSQKGNKHPKDTRASRKNATPGLDKSVIEWKAIVAAFVTALIFGIHPLHVESVAWVSERKDVLCAFFFLLSIIFYIRYASGVPKALMSYAMSLLFFILALISKPMAVSLPLILLIIDFYPLERLRVEVGLRIRRAKGILIEKIPFVMFSLFSALLTIWAQRSGDALSSVDLVPFKVRALVAIRSFIFYLYKMLFPSDLAPIYLHPIKVNFFDIEYLGSLLLVTSITALSVYLLRRHKLFLVIWLYYIFTLIPVSGIVQVGVQAAADRYTYLPSLGPFLLTGLGVGFLYQRYSKRGSRLAIISVLVFLSVVMAKVSVKQAAIWHDSITLWSHEIEIFPDEVAIAYNGRGGAYKEAGSFNEAIDDFNSAIKIHPEYAPAYYNRGSVYYSLGLYQESIKDFGRAIKINPEYAEAYNNRGGAYYNLGKYEESARDSSRAVEIKPDYSEAYSNRGAAYYNLGLYRASISDFNKAIEFNTGYADAYFKLGIVYLETGNNELARTNFVNAARLGSKQALDYLRK